MKKIFFILCIILLSFFFIKIIKHNHRINITDYHRVFIPCYDEKGNLRISIRMYNVGSKIYFLQVNPYTFATQTIPANACYTRNITVINTNPELSYIRMQALQATPYIQALMKYTSPPYPLQRYGINEAAHVVNANFLTVDMCPSVKPFEKDFFHALVAKAKALHQAMPVALSVSGLWIIDHPKEFHWLIRQEKKHHLEIIWVNHTFSHIYLRDVPIESNFLLMPQVNVDAEILELEKLLLENGQLPSVFFRFPGLISNQEMVLKLRQYGLIPIASDAWLATGDQIKPGSIVLVHGNSNEPAGIKDVMPLLQRNDLHWLPLTEAFAKGND